MSNHIALKSFRTQNIINLPNINTYSIPIYIGILFKANGRSEDYLCELGKIRTDCDYFCSKVVHTKVKVSKGSVRESK